jgi:DNA-binding TFAR19-related protein (PDSD5 family)
MGALDSITRAQAGELLRQAQESQALAQIIEAHALADGIELNPATIERLERARTLERCLIQLLASRAPRPVDEQGAIGRP